MSHSFLFVKFTLCHRPNSAVASNDCAIDHLHKDHCTQAFGRNTLSKPHNGPGFREYGVHVVSEFIDSFKLGFYLVWFKAHLQVSAGVKHEESLLGGRMHMVVVLELGQWK